jgi:hypothetical protein
MVFAEFDSGTPQLTELLRVGEQWLEMFLDSFNPYLVKKSGTMDSCSKYYEDKVAARGFVLWQQQSSPRLVIFRQKIPMDSIGTLLWRNLEGFLLDNPCSPVRRLSISMEDRF